MRKTLMLQKTSLQTVFIERVKVINLCLHPPKKPPTNFAITPDLTNSPPGKKDTSIVPDTEYGFSKYMENM